MPFNIQCRGRISRSLIRCSGSYISRSVVFKKVVLSQVVRDQFVKLSEYFFYAVLFYGPVVVHLAVKTDHDISFCKVRVVSDTFYAAVDIDDDEVRWKTVCRPFPIAINDYFFLAAVNKSNGNFPPKKVTELDVWLYKRWFDHFFLGLKIRVLKTGSIATSQQSSI